MQLKIIDSGSQGNCAILKDRQGNQIILDCGVKYEKIAVELDWDKPMCCIVSHFHSDHSLSVGKLRSSGVMVYEHCNFQNGSMFNLMGAYNILPIELPHDKDTTSYSFLIYNKVENKSIFFATDCTELPNIADNPYDLIMCEINYDEETVGNKCSMKNIGYTRHLSLEYVCSWLESHQNKPKVFVATHLSNSENISLKKLVSKLEAKCDKLVVSQKNICIEI